MEVRFSQFWFYSSDSYSVIFFRVRVFLCFLLKVFRLLSFAIFHKNSNHFFNTFLSNIYLKYCFFVFRMFFSCIMCRFSCIYWNCNKEWSLAIFLFENVLWHNSNEFWNSYRKSSFELLILFHFSWFLYDIFVLFYGFSMYSCTDSILSNFYKKFEFISKNYSHKSTVL